MKNFELASGRFGHACPQCKTPIDAATITTCAVSNCSWEWKGRRVAGGDLITGRGEADNAYYVFPDGHNDTVAWHTLQLLAVRME